MKRLVAILCCIIILSPAWAEGKKRPMTIDDLFKFKRVSDPQISPDGKQVAYVVGSVDMDANKIYSSIWLAATDGKTPPRQLTNAAGKKDGHPRWSPDGKNILFQSNRSGEMQLWLIGLDGGEAKQLTTISTGAAEALWSRDGKKIAFVSAVYPEFSEKPFKESDAANKKKIDEIEKSPVKAKVFTKLFYRHWDSWVEDKRQHLFLISFDGARRASEGDPRDVTPGDRDAFPTSDTFSTGDNFTFSPDGTHVVFTAVPEKNEAWSTNYDICRVAVAGGTTKWECLTKDNPAADSGPVFSPDGKKLAYRAQKTAGYEADRWQLMVVDVTAAGAISGTPQSLTEKLDRWVDSFAWEGDAVVFGVEEKAAARFFRTDLFGVMDNLADVKGVGGLSMNRAGIKVCTKVAMNHPVEVFRLDYENVTGNPTLRLPVHAVPLSHANDKLLAELDLPRPESVTIPGAGGTPMQMWILKPPGFDPAKKWPVAFLVHGGPQGAWEDGWSFRWNPQLWAAQGYIVALPNPRGSTGFGQKYIDEITGDWGGKCYEDLMKGVDYLETLPYVDKNRIGAAGASFGGYMMDWFAVNTGRFKCLITHCSVYNFDSMYATTDEIWFDEWEHGGPPWGKNRESYEKHSPQRLAGNLGKFKTPMLVIHNDNDFRCPIGQGQELFTALQRQGVPSRFVNFPDEGHWVLKPKNSERWHQEVFAWLKKYVPPGGK
jgi:dipeptidyl aminopeptidase/acylaminoacyl peptidase